ncbi:hypothetical protein [Romboutsia lituseburensis]|uniref:hypothetical protein n=1 Tax=Romboutsia lituseburensis TaxID=1537 RepID=UPI00215AAB3D|nr:hypothetical protein [Romboutsia lituseburensis]MCR8744418.1 hypothetical protein [Romboutsia lituseburensis]
MKLNKIKIVFKNDFVKIVERDNIRNFNSLIDWMEQFKNGENVALLTLSSKELGSSFSIDKNNIKLIEILND